MTRIEPISKTVSVIDSDPTVSEQLRDAFNAEGVHTESYATAADFFSRYDPAIPGCLIVELKLPELDAIALLRRSRQQGWNSPAIILAEKADANSAISCLELGVVAYLLKPVDIPHLVQRTHSAIAHDIASRDREALREASRARFEKFSPREREIVGLLIAGNSNKQIAAILGVAKKTVVNHRLHLMSKAGAINTADLVWMATIAGIQPDPRKLPLPGRGNTAPE